MNISPSASIVKPLSVSVNEASKGTQEVKPAPVAGASSVVPKAATLNSSSSAQITTPNNPTSTSVSPTKDVVVKSSGEAFNLQTGASTIAGLRHVHSSALPQVTSLPSSNSAGTGSEIGGNFSNEKSTTETSASSIAGTNPSIENPVKKGNTQQVTGRAINADNPLNKETSSTQDGTQVKTAPTDNEVDDKANDSVQNVEGRILDTLKARDTEVKAHESAHASVGGIHAQSPNFEYQRGSDGQRYAVNGEVQIDVTPVHDDPLATIAKMKQIYAAAMAPVDPSMADIRVASNALQNMNEAKQKLTDEMVIKAPDITESESLISLGRQNEANQAINEQDLQGVATSGAQSSQPGSNSGQEISDNISMPTAKLELTYGMTKAATASLAFQV